MEKLITEAEQLKKAKGLFEKDKKAGFWHPETRWEDIIDTYKQHYLSETDPNKKRESYDR